MQLSFMQIKEKWYCCSVLYYTVDAINQTNSVIEKRNLDGSNNTPFINSQLKSPAGITIDQTGESSLILWLSLLLYSVFVVYNGGVM